MTHSERLAVGGTITGQPYRPTPIGHAKAALFAFLGVFSCAMAYVLVPR